MFYDQQRFIKTFLEPIIEKAKHEGRPIVFIDFINTGKSLKSFYDLFITACPDCDSSFINLAENENNSNTYYNSNPLSISHKGQVVLPKLVAAELFNEVYPRLLPYHPHRNWGFSSKEMIPEWEQKEETKKIIEQLEQLN